MDIEFDASGTQEIVTVPVVSDAVHEPTKSFAARLSLPAAQRSVVLGQSIATIVINDDDGMCMALSVFIVLSYVLFLQLLQFSLRPLSTMPVRALDSSA